MLDQPVWWWVQSVIEDPSRADAWRVVHQPDPIDEKRGQALAAAERAVANREAEAATLLDNLGLLTGAAARAAADRLNDLYERLDIARRRVTHSRTAPPSRPPMDPAGHDGSKRSMPSPSRR